ncbi:hypothetical protein ABMA27_016544 [Loxostege sticticalis]|uniref:Carboxylesterase type B domain-containing protein n=1 Tax=Loxostege sticticalis TaxID=481309 RepID=A0ABR3I2N0_LOXSC
MLQFVLSASVVLIAAECSVVITTTGPVRGKLVQDEHVSYYAYLGIPYAEPPKGDLRFKPPIPKQAWTQVLNATDHGPVCPQPEGKHTRDQMSEDCLYLNVIVPANVTQKTLPVLVYIHGGSFKSNSGNIDSFYGPEFFVKRGIIYVSINYRLGALGYLSLGTDKAPGNAGIKDVLLALKWLNKNIQKFGGSSITIGGQSSGAATVHYLMLTEKSKGLFNQAILNSGSATNFRFLAAHPKENALALADQLGVQNHDDMENVVQHLIEADVFDIVDAQESIYKNNRNPMRAFAPFVPSIEKESDDAIITENPTDIIKAGMPQNLPILAGINGLEGAFMWPSLHKLPSETLREIFPLCIPADIEYPTDSDAYADLVDSISELYFGSRNLSKWTQTRFYKLVTDTQYTYSVDSWIKVHKSRHDSERLYYYLFDFDGDLNWAKLKYDIDFPGAVHSDEIGYLFVTPETKPILKNIDTRSQQTLDNMLNFVTNFIKHGNPTPEGYGGKVTWPESGKDRHHLVINDCPEVVSQAPNKIRFDFWEQVYIEYSEYTN